MHGWLVGIALAAVAGIAVVVEVPLQSKVDLETGYRLLYLICWLSYWLHSAVVEAPRSWKHWVTLDHFHLSLLDAEVRESVAHASLLANQVLF